MKISSNFDSGNIELVSQDDKGDFQLKIRKDTSSDFLQWFHFRLTGAKEQHCKISIINAGETSYPKGWENYNACASYDKIEWFRIPTTFVDGKLTMDFTPMHNSVHIAYFAPYSYEQHQEMVHQAQLADNCELSSIGQTVQGKEMDMLTIGDMNPSKKKIWLIARQHPGESMAEWFIEGAIGRLLDPTDPHSRKILEDANIYVIPNMNIDGSIAGNLRSNFAGANLNREWENPRLKESPEVYHTLKKMDEIGVDLLLDVHGDEELPYNFVAGSEGIPNYTERMKALEDKFKAHWILTCPDFQDEYNYGPDEPGKANMTVCSNQVSSRFDCLAYTIEMPFKDNNDLPDELYGWSNERSIKLGESVLLPILQVLGDI
ncbi:MAG: murein tripeptide amidase MpaA [Patiriisocius sp.]|jgi:murein tripeptide amidase MpaA